MEIHNNIEFKHAFAELDKLIADGFQGNEALEMRFSELAVAIEHYEDHVLMLVPIGQQQPAIKIKQPTNIVEMIELKMYENKWKQKDLATVLEISETRLSEIIKGKRKVNLDLAKRLYLKLNIDADFILKAL